MLEKLGNRRYALPFVAFLVVACVMSLVVYPMVNAEPKGLRLGILSLDEGAEVPGADSLDIDIDLDIAALVGDDAIDTSSGWVNVGDTVVEEILEVDEDGDTEEVSWTVYESKQALDEAVQNEELYGAIVIPADFSRSQIEKKKTEMQKVALPVAAAVLTKAEEQLATTSEEAAEAAAEAADAVQSKVDAAASAANQAATAVKAAVQAGGEAGATAAAAQVTAQVATQTAQAAAAAASAAAGVEDKVAAAATAANNAATAVKAAVQSGGEAGAAQAAAQATAQAATQTAAAAAASAQFATQIKTIADKAPAGDTKTQLTAVAQAAAQAADSSQAAAQAAAAAAAGAAAAAPEKADAAATAANSAAGAVQAAVEAGAAAGAAKAAEVATETMAEKTGEAAEEAREAKEEVQAKADEATAAEIPETSPFTVIIDVGKNPMVAASVETMMTGMIAEQGQNYEVERVEDADIGGGSLNLALLFTVLPTFIMSMLCSVALYVMTRPAATATRPERLRATGIRIGLAIILSGFIGFGTTAILSFSGVSVPALTTGLFLWLASLCLLLLFAGFLSIAPPLGALVILACFACGMACGNLPYELLPTFYQDWFYPWVPQRFISNGIRQIYYTGAGPVNSAAGGLLIMGALGLVALLLGALKPQHSNKADHKPGLLAAHRKGFLSARKNKSVLPLPKSPESADQQTLKQTTHPSRVFSRQRK